MKAVQARTRISLKNILFATDFSPAADAAAPFAIQIARSYGAKMYGVHVNPFDNYTAAAADAWAAMAEAAERQTKEHAQRLNEQLMGVEHEVVIGEGNIWEVISNLIKEKEIDLIVLGTRGRTGLGKALLGSVAEQILRQAPCPVLTVGPHVTLQPEKAVRMREILYATDLAADFPLAAPYAISLAQENQAHLALLYVIENQKTGELVHPAELADSKLHKLRQLVPQEAELWCEPRYLVEQGTPAEKILEAADRQRADLIVLGAQPAKWLATQLNAGTVHKVVSEAKCPVLTVHGRGRTKHGVTPSNMLHKNGVEVWATRVSSEFAHLNPSWREKEANMSTTFQDRIQSQHKTSTSMMKALVFRGPNQIGIEHVPIPKPGPGEAVIRVTLTTICGTDIHILKGEYPVKPGLIIGHEPVGIIHEIGVGVSGYRIGERVLVGAITPFGQCNYCLSGDWSQCGGASGGWKFGNTINGAQAEYLLVPNAQANLAKIPDDLRDEQVVLLADIASTGISAAESADLQIGDTVAIFAQGPIGLCATAGAKLKGASLIIAVESDPVRSQMAKRMGADVVLNFKETDVITEIKRLTDGKGVDVAIEALGTQGTFENALRVLRAGGTLSSLGVYSGKLSVPLEPFAAGLGDHKIVTTLCPGGKERMCRLMELVRHGRLNLAPLLTHTFSLDDITEAYKVFGERREGVIKVAIKP